MTSAIEQWVTERPPISMGIRLCFGQQNVRTGKETVGARPQFEILYRETQLTSSPLVFPIDGANLRSSPDCNFMTTSTYL